VPWLPQQGRRKSGTGRAPSSRAGWICSMARVGSAHDLTAMAARRRSAHASRVKHNFARGGRRSSCGYSRRRRRCPGAGMQNAVHVRAAEGQPTGYDLQDARPSHRAGQRPGASARRGSWSPRRPGTGPVSLIRPRALGAGPLAGWDVAALTYLAWTWSTVWHLGAEHTARQAVREDPGRATADQLSPDLSTPRGEGRRGDSLELCGTRKSGNATAYDPQRRPCHRRSGAGASSG
jgi:hypothetical protein